MSLTEELEIDMNFSKMKISLKKVDKDYCPKPSSTIHEVSENPCYQFLEQQEDAVIYLTEKDVDWFNQQWPTAKGSKTASSIATKLRKIIKMHKDRNNAKFKEGLTLKMPASIFKVEQVNGEWIYHISVHNADVKLTEEEMTKIIESE